MIIYLAGENAEAWKKRGVYNFNRLASFYYIKDEAQLIHKFDQFMLDSGAFTFITQKTKLKINWEQYTIRYAEFIKKYNVKLFLELDIDSLVGLKKVEELRELLEQQTGKPSIPVWHKSRGLNYWNKMCKEYDYVAIGGIANNEIKRTEYKYFTKLLNIASANHCKVHGLAFTNLKGVVKYKFHSVDSTAWLSGNRFGGVYYFNGKTMEKVNKKPGQRVVTNKTAIHNFTEWVKFAKYAERHL